MCFYNDCDWYASLVIDEIKTADKPLQCLECGERIEAGQQYRDIFQQQHETCWRCFGGACVCEEPQLGEQYSYRRCLSCDKFLEAVAAVEKDAGCSSYESTPMLENMLDAIQEVDRAECAKYFRRARRTFPELWESGYLRRLAKRVY